MCGAIIETGLDAPLLTTFALVHLPVHRLYSVDYRTGEYINLYGEGDYDELSNSQPASTKEAEGIIHDNICVIAHSV